MIRWSWTSRYKKSSPKQQRTFTSRKWWAERITTNLSGLLTFMTASWGWSSPTRLPSWTLGLRRVENRLLIKWRDTSQGITTMILMSTFGKPHRLCFPIPKSISFPLINSDELLSLNNFMYLFHFFIPQSLMPKIIFYFHSFHTLNSDN